ncbi:DUF4238 domain-containing protein [Paenibacillus sp. 2TAB26]|uniref:DUF4238 domain-containing protein n=1 Tax=Paenibacillus sp. 2TAB26 TaxID=3233005 RepID=UPI003F969156
MIDNDIRKNQHIVPHTYLLNFAEKGTVKAYVYDKVEDYFFPKATNVKKIIRRRYWYDIDFQGLESLPEYKRKGIPLEFHSQKQINEKILSMCEGHLQKIIDLAKSSATHSTLNNWFIRYMIYQLVVIQMLRTVSGKKMLLEIKSKLSGKNLEDQFTNVLFLKELLDILNDERESTFVNFLFNEFNHVKIGKNTTTCSLITSDNPVLFIQNYKSSGKNALYYPLSTECALILTCSENVDNNFLSEEEENVQELLNENDVRILNSMIFISADQFIVSNTKLSETEVLTYRIFQEKIRSEKN